jgi:hypothetical protein
MSYQKVKMQQRKEREKGFLRLLPGRKSMHFFGKEVLRERYRKEQRRKEKQKRVNCIKLVPIILIKGSCYETPLNHHVLATSGTVIRTRYEKGEEPPEGGGGRGEGV